MNVVTPLRANEDIGPYQLLRPQLCDITQKFTSVMRQAVALAGPTSADPSWAAQRIRDDSMSRAPPTPPCQPTPAHGLPHLNPDPSTGFVYPKFDS